MAALPNTLLTVTLASNFGTFLLYMLSCVTCMVAYHNHPKFSVLRHFLIPVFGVLANLACMVTYLVGPFLGIRHQGGATAGIGDCVGLGHLRRNLLRDLVARGTGRTTLAEASRRLALKLQPNRNSARMQGGLRSPSAS